MSENNIENKNKEKNTGKFESNSNKTKEYINRFRVALNFLNSGFNELVKIKSTKQKAKVARLVLIAAFLILAGNNGATTDVSGDIHVLDTATIVDGKTGAVIDVVTFLKGKHI